jgi:hypothetical protein
MNNIEKIDRLVQCINTTISQCRSSLSDEDVCLLKECVTFLESVKCTDSSKELSTELILTTVCQVILRVVLAEGTEKLKDILF